VGHFLKYLNITDQTANELWENRSRTRVGMTMKKKWLGHMLRRNYARITKQAIQSTPRNAEKKGDSRMREKQIWSKKRGWPASGTAGERWRQYNKTEQDRDK